MKRVFSSGAAVLTAAWMFAGCYSNNRVGNDALSIGTARVDGGSDGAGATSGVSLVLEIDGMTFQAGCTNGETGLSFRSGGTGSCGETFGEGPTFTTMDCYDAVQAPPTVLPDYFVGVLFSNFDPATGIPVGTTFDLSQPGHEQFITVMMGDEDLTGTEYEYCSTPPTDLPDGGMYPASSGVVTVNRFAPEDNPGQTFSTDVELSNVVVPSTNGGPTMKVVAAHMYF
jgi:hypothetical protein